MSDLQAILNQIDELSRDEQVRLWDYVEQKLYGQLNMTPEEKIAALDKALENFWEGFTQAEVDEMTAEMNAKPVDHDDSDMCDWIEDLSEDKR